MADERTAKKITEELRTMPSQDRVTIEDIGNALRNLTVAVENLDQRITDLWPTT
jgi:ubiquinone biosynthesis protein UbiJ